MNQETLQTALWSPGWYELDQTLVLGERKKYWFFQDPPARRGDMAHEEADLVFFNQLDSSENCFVRYARIVEMVHPKLGPLLRIDTDGLDYIFYPVLGEEVVVNAEEAPGTTYNEQANLMIDDWSVYVKLAEVTEPTGELV
jgi:hypothetical protein